MKKAFLVDAGKLVVKEVPKPEQTSSAAVMLKLRYAAICGSDLHFYKIGPNLPPDLRKLTVGVTGDRGIEVVFGYEWSGEIVETYPNTPKGWEVGDRVVGGAYINAFKEYAIVDEAQMGSGVYHLSDDLSYEQGALIEPAAVALTSVKNSMIKPRQTALILGAGPIGLLILQTAKALGAGAVYVTDIVSQRIAKAWELGADEVLNASEVDVVKRVGEVTKGEGVDVVYECAGVQATFQQMLETLKPHGTGVAVSIFEREISVNPSVITLKNLKIIGSIGLRRELRDPLSGIDFWSSIMTQVRRGRIRLLPLITSIMPLEEIDRAFKSLVKGNDIKILIKN